MYHVYYFLFFSLIAGTYNFISQDPTNLPINFSFMGPNLPITFFFSRPNLPTTFFPFGLNLPSKDHLGPILPIPLFSHLKIIKETITILDNNISFKY